ncbi:MAG: DUF84 family protein, partial [Gammaproteobacteria bacterium]|nr:DUF84 family protein [Gammaproteobacteria bacterium]
MNNKLIKVMVGSRNPVKIKAVQGAMSTVFNDSVIECIGVDAPSLVAEQPMSGDETRTGAINRVR